MITNQGWPMNPLELLRKTAYTPLEDAYSLPFSSYTDLDVLEAERQCIFHDEWVFVCMAGEVANKGSYYALDLAGEPIVLVRGEDSILRVFANICRHRGTPLFKDGFGQIDRNIVCPYHAWSYTLDGALKAIPFNKQIVVNNQEHRLREFQLEIWCGLVFIHLGNNPKSLKKRLSRIPDLVSVFELDSFDTAIARSAETWQANWKLTIENAIESYHLFRVHKQTLEQYTSTREAYYIAGSSEWSLTGGKGKSGGGFLSNMFGSKYHQIFDHYILISIPPSFVGVLEYGSLGWLSSNPVDQETTRIRSGTLGKAGKIDTSESSAAFTQAFFKEDKEICERVQRGMTSRFGSGGKLLDMDKVVVDFHQFIATRLFNLEPSPYHETPQAEKFRMGNKAV